MKKVIAILLVLIGIGAGIGFPLELSTIHNYEVRGKTNMMAADAALMSLERKDGIVILNNANDTVLVVYNFETTDLGIAHRWNLDYTEIACPGSLWLLGSILGLLLAIGFFGSAMLVWEEE